MHRSARRLMSAGVSDAESLAYLQIAACDRRNVFEALMEATKALQSGQISRALYDTDLERRRNM